MACGVPTPTGTTGSDDEPAARDRVDVHVHLVGGAVDELLAALDRNAIAAAVVIASPHLDPALGLAPGPDARMHGWREANDALLAATAAHRARLFPFVAVEPAEVDIPALEGWFQGGARGVKLYFGHQKLHARPLDDPAHASLFEWLEQRSVPVLVHVNTVRYRDELARVLRAHPRLELVCAHLCGSRTDLDRLAGLLREFPRLRVDTSHGAGLPGVDGFTAIEEDRDRLRALIEFQPERFLFGSDLVTARGPPATSTPRAPGTCSSPPTSACSSASGSSSGATPPGSARSRPASTTASRSPSPQSPACSEATPAPGSAPIEHRELQDMSRALCLMGHALKEMPDRACP
ncbi:amidohydrolase family protein [Nannocystis pusilla]|uniref:amidohydrolase family protein n=1 Tax=Nannocystis pusilla TaxID=889268 RepID=UPI003B7A4391